MTTGNNSLHLNKTSWSKIRTILLCVLLTILFVCGASAIVIAETTPELDPREQLKSRIMWQIQYEGWDPYSSDMTLDEFYALMELFEEGKLPLNNTVSKKPSKVASNGFAYGPYADDPSTEEPSVDEFIDLTIPRAKFLFAGIPDSYVGDNSPLPYDDEIGGYNKETGLPEETENYPGGLDSYGVGYKRPPQDWTGIPVNTRYQAVIVKENVNSNNPAVAGDVDQKFFLPYDGYYVKRVTIDGVDAAILGMIKMQDTDEEKYVYYYMSASDQDTTVSSTALPDAKKFIVQYVPVEHLIEYKVQMADGSNVPAGISENSIFGTDHPKKTTDGAYAFDVVAPYEYEMVLLLQYTMTVEDVTFNGQHHDKIAFEVEEELAGTKEFGKASADLIKNNLLNAYKEYLQGIGVNFDLNQVDGDSDPVTLTYNGADAESHDKVLEKIAARVNAFVLHNDGFALGKEPYYEVIVSGKIMANPNNSPSSQTMNATFYNNAVTENRTIIAILKKNDKQPWFTAPIIFSNVNNTRERGASATTATYEVIDRKTNQTVTVPYDYEDEFLSLTGQKYPDGSQSKYIWPTTAAGNNGNDIGNIRPSDGKWTWDSTGYGNTITPNNSPMTPAGDGTYNWQYTFQTNSPGQNFILDVLEINGVSLKIPFSPKYVASSHNGEEKQGTASGNTSYVTETTLANGAIVRLEYLVAFGNTQRVYRLTVTGAKSNVNITGMNLMMYNTGAAEFSVYNLTGVYAPQEGNTSQLNTVVDYFDKAEKTWKVAPIANVIVDLIDYGDANTDFGGANIRFKTMDGYGSPYYIFESRLGGAIDGQTSVVEFNEDGTAANQNDVIKFSDLNGGNLQKGYVYYDDTNNDGWYYIRLTGQSNYKIALLTIVARPARYVLHYIPGVIVDEDTGETRMPKDMPTFDHYDICHESFNEEYDDNNGYYYNLFSNNIAKLPTNDSGLIRPYDPEDKYVFKDWVAVDEFDVPILVDGKEFHFLSNSIDITGLYEYAVLNDELGGSEMDIYVIRLMPTWEKVQNPYRYNVVLNWVDSQGIINEVNFSQYWKQVLTESPDNGELYVYLNKEAKPLLEWIADHPTYTFWDDVNNAADIPEGAAEQTIRESLDKYFKIDLGYDKPANYEEIVAALLKLDFGGALDGEGNSIPDNAPDFVRIGNNHFVVKQNNGTISIWMYENKGGLVFHKDVQGESFICEDEFYFTVTQVLVGENDTLLDGEYKAYPETAYDENGKERRVSDDDAWTVKFINGAIESIIKDNVNYGTYFILKDGEGIYLYVPAGTYTVAELGSKSGGSYNVSVAYEYGDGSNVSHESWYIPEDELYVEGNRHEYFGETPPAGVKQVAAVVDFEIGAVNVVQTLKFTNITTSLSITKQLEGDMTQEQQTYYNSLNYNFTVKFNLPAGETPIFDTDHYYFNINVYRTVNRATVGYSERIVMVNDKSAKEGDNVWVGQFQIKAGEKAIIVMKMLNVNVSYWVDETDVPEDLTPHITPKNGSVQPGKQVTVKVVNRYGEEPDFGYLVITETGGKATESFLFTIKGEGVELVVSVKGGKQTYVYVPLGEYTIVEISGWSWRYEAGMGTAENDLDNLMLEVTVEVSAANASKDTAAHADFYNDPDLNMGWWLGGESSKKSLFY